MPGVNRDNDRGQRALLLLLIPWKRHIPAFRAPYPGGCGSESLKQ